MARIALRRRRLALARAEDLIEGDQHQARFRNAKALMQLSDYDGARRLRAGQKGGDSFVRQRYWQIVTCEQLAQARRVSLRRGDEYQFFGLPAFDPLDQRQQRWIAAAPRRFLTHIAGEKGFHRER